MAGPIVRPTHLTPQFETPHLANLKKFGWGLGLVILGLFQKVVIADGLLATASEVVSTVKVQCHFLMHGLVPSHLPDKYFWILLGTQPRLLG